MWFWSFSFLFKWIFLFKKKHLVLRATCLTLLLQITALSIMVYYKALFYYLYHYLFSLYMLPLGNIIHCHGVDYHHNADDMQLFIAITLGKPLTVLDACVADIKLFVHEIWCPCSQIFKRMPSFPNKLSKILVLLYY